MLLKHLTAKLFSSKINEGQDFIPSKSCNYSR